MRKCLLIFLLMFLPLHFTWAAAAGYCRHESNVSPVSLSNHFGHHDHQHQTDDGNKQDKQSSAASSDIKIKTEASDADCTACHAGCLSAMTSSPVLGVAVYRSSAVDDYRFRFKSPPVVQLDRPQWFAPV